MAVVYLNWHEAGEGELPAVCISCGAPATHVATRRLSVSRHHLFSIHTRYATVRLPVCRQHLRPAWVYWSRVVATEITQDGIKLKHVAGEFVDALWDYREDREDRPRRRHRADPEEDDWEEPRTRRPGRRRLQEYDPAPLDLGGTLGKMVLILFVLGFVCAGGMAVFMFFVLRWL